MFEDEVIGIVFPVYGLCVPPLVEYKVNTDCTGCGVCGKVCPTDNIHIENGKPIFGERCISCLGCVQNCPFAAIYLEGEKSNTRYRNPHISLKEIIDANA